MKCKKTNIKKIIKKRIKLQQTKIGVRHKLRISDTPPRPIPVDLVSRGEVRRGEIINGYHKISDYYHKIFSSAYIRKDVVDYDAVIIISSYNRFEKLNNILKQLHEQKSKYKIKIIVYNDGSTDINYNKISELYCNVIYLDNKINNGKYKYWETITRLFKKAAEFESHVVIQIDDDFILCDNFIDSLLDKFFEVKYTDNKNVLIYYHVAERNNGNQWGMKNWFDGGALFDTVFLSAINNEIEPISIRRWKFDSKMSSGVWFQVSKKISDNGLLVYKLDESLVKHDGNFDSKMNAEERKIKPIHTKNFKS